MFLSHQSYQVVHGSKRKCKQCVAIFPQRKLLHAQVILVEGVKKTQKNEKIIQRQDNHCDHVDQCRKRHLQG